MTSKLNLGGNQKTGSTGSGNSSYKGPKAGRRKTGSETEDILGAWPRQPADRVPAALPEPVFFLWIFPSFHSATLILSSIPLTCLARGGPRAFVLAVSSAWNAFPHLLTPGWFITPFRSLFCHLLQEALLHFTSTGGTSSPPSHPPAPLPDFVPSTALPTCWHCVFVRVFYLPSCTEMSSGNKRLESSLCTRPSGAGRVGPSTETV